MSESTIKQYQAYRSVIDRTAGMADDPHIRQLAEAHGLDVLSLTWEDTGRFKDSAVGPNISDMTIQVQQQDPQTQQYQLSLMPVIRHPNFTDKTGDVELDRFFVTVGNHRDDGELERITLRQLLANPRAYMSQPTSWKGEHTSLLAERDTHVLVSAQACFLPIPRAGEAVFNPVLFNYQSTQGNPAVLAILITREGTSMTVIDNVRDGFEAGDTWGQRLFFNKAGERASLTGQRISDFHAGQQASGQTDGRAADRADGDAGLNMVMLIQVPLKQKTPPRRTGVVFSVASSMLREEAMAPDVEEAVIGHGPVEGPFTEFDDLPIERDPRFPVRVTVQFYKATSNGQVSEQDIAGIAAQIERVYDDADYVGSLVVEGPTGRPTEHEGPMVEPPDWWDEFWQRHEQNTGQSREQAIRMLRKLLGEDYRPVSEQQLREDTDSLPTSE
ncbi:hypothetical protein ACERK3_19025 [Phycisphaerales bacterium AB-hyl4]|uniref:Uncharacterized protein n=1 Tax=Natronomicrosphaera hydrolytica TaxID=3242702 RepID=A0ABV4UC30_9BACT